MRDYEKTIKDLRSCGDRNNLDCKGCSRDLSPICNDELENDAADAIEELLAENAEWKTELRHTLDKNEELLAAVPKWVSVEDEPPKENGRYLVRYKRDVDLGDGETVHDDKIRVMRFFVDDGWRYPIICNDHVRLVNEEVTHWMPLPKAPKEVE